MKKIVALVLSLVMVLGLATTAFAVVPIYGAGTEVEYDEFDAKANTYTGVTETFTYYPAKAPVLDKNGYCVTPGQIAHWVNEANTAAYVMVDTYSPYAAFAVKAAQDGITVGQQTTPDALFFMVPAYAVEYGYTGTVFTAFGTKCGDYAKPAGALDTDVFVTQTSGFNTGKVFQVAVATSNNVNNVLVNGQLYVGVAAPLDTIKHAWAVVDYTEKGVIDTCKCLTCGIEGTWVESIYLAPSGSKADNVFGGYVWYTGAVAGDKVESAQTFDAGIAMYVGMSVMAAAGSAVVLKKKD